MVGGAVQCGYIISSVTHGAGVTHADCILLLEVFKRLSATSTLFEVQAIVRQAARELTGADGITVVLREGDEVFYADEDAIGPLWKGRRFPMNACVSGWCMARRELVVIDDIYADDRVPLDSYRPTFVKSLAMAPIRASDPIGAIGAYWADNHRASEREVAVLQQLADATAIAMEKVALTCSIEVSRDRAEASESEFRALFDFMPQLGWTARPDGFIDHYNAGWYEYTGTVPADMAGWGWQSVHDPKMLPEVMERWRHSLETGTPFEMEFKLRGHDGVFRWFLTRVRPMRDAAGQIVRWVGINTDIDDQKRAEMERGELLEQAQAAARAKDEFLAMLGHELRNPLAPIVTALQLLRLRGSDAGERERNIIERQVQHLIRLVDDLLDVSRITRGTLDLRKQRTEIAEVVARGIEIAKPLLEQRRQRLDVQMPRRGLAVHGDPSRLAQIVSNLLTNAAKFTDPSGSIFVTAARESDVVVLRVRDTGVGISGEMLPSIFEAFVQERQALDRSQGGLGLGLAIVRSLVLAHGGDVEAHSEGPGRGAEFVVRLPALEPMVAVEEPEPPSRSNVDGHGQRVLVVDDNEDAATLLAMALEGLGHEVRVAHDGPSALSVVQTFTPDVAFLDIGLPAMDGYELAAQLRARPALERVRLVALTGYGQQSDRETSHRAGFSAHLVKPVELAEIEAVIVHPAA